MSLEQTKNSVEKQKCLIQVFGLGYVGFPLSVRLSKGGFQVLGIDVNNDRISRLEKNLLLDSEIYLKNEYLECRKNQRYDVSDIPKKTKSPKIAIICVPTPIPKEGLSSNVFVNEAVETFLKIAEKGDVIILESSLEVGSTNEIKNLIESKGFKIGFDFGLCFCPERIDPLNKKWNLENIPRVIYCSDDISFKIAQNLYHHVNNGHLFRVKDAKTAEVVKSFENTFRLVNISLVNELALLCDKLGISAKEIIKAASTKPFGFMPFEPGPGVGGHCIPKDPKFLLESSKKEGITFRTIENALNINNIIPKYIVDQIQNVIEEMNLPKSVLVCGLAYKPNIEDMRDSPGFKIIKELSERNFIVGGFDPYYKKEVSSKYLKENNLSSQIFKEIENLNDENIKEFSCICIVQHHNKTKFRLLEIYEKSLIPFIYDCRNEIIKNHHSHSKLEVFGGK